jgi:hypothetical protein
MQIVRIHGLLVFFFVSSKNEAGIMNVELGYLRMCPISFVVLIKASNTPKKVIGYVISYTPKLLPYALTIEVRLDQLRVGLNLKYKASPLVSIPCC